MSQLRKSLIVSALILAIAVPASAMLANGNTGGGSAVVRVSGNTSSFTSILGGVSSGKAAKEAFSLFGSQQKIFRLKS